MLFKIKLKNADDFVVVDDFVYEYLTTNARLKSLKFVENLRKHSSGCVVFQKSWRKATGGYEVETIYLNRLVAEKFLERPDGVQNQVVLFKNRKKLDCRVENLIWSTRSVSTRNSRSKTKSGYRGVYKNKGKYVAEIYNGKQRIYIGRFETAEEAAMAYNKKSVELFGKDGKINKVVKVPEQETVTEDKA